MFNFSKQHLKELAQIKATVEKLFVVLVCVEDREICCLSIEELLGLIKRRKSDVHGDEDQYTVLVAVPKGKRMRVYVSAHGIKKTILGDPLLIGRNEFPEKLFV